MSARRSGRYWKLLVAIVLAVGFLYLVFRKLDWDQFWTTLAGVHLAWIVAALFVLAADFSTRTCRWWVMLRRVNSSLPLRTCFTPFMGCLALNNVLPFRTGDAIRVVAFRERLGVNSSTLLATLVIERVLDLGCLLILLSAALPFLAQHTIPAEWLATMHGLSIALVVACFVAILANRPALRFLRSIMARPFVSQHPAVHRVLAYGEGVLVALDTIHSIKTYVLLLFLSLLAWVLEGGIFWCVAVALGISAPPVAAWLSMTLATLSTLIPSTPGYIGPYHYFATQGMTGYGVPVSQAAAFAFLSHAVVFGSTTLWGGYLLLAANVPLPFKGGNTPYPDASTTPLSLKKD